MPVKLPFEEENTYLAGFVSCNFWMNSSRKVSSNASGARKFRFSTGDK